MRRYEIEDEGCTCGDVVDQCSGISEVLEMENLVLLLLVLFFRFSFFFDRKKEITRVGLFELWAFV